MILKLRDHYRAQIAKQISEVANLKQRYEQEFDKRGEKKTLGGLLTSSMSKDKPRSSYQSGDSSLGKGKKKGKSRGEFIVEASPYQDQQEESSSGTLAILRADESNGK